MLGIEPFLPGYQPRMDPIQIPTSRRPGIYRICCRVEGLLQEPSGLKKPMCRPPPIAIRAWDSSRIQPLSRHNSHVYQSTVKVLPGRTVICPVRRRVSDIVRRENRAARPVGELQDMVIVFSEEFGTVLDEEYDVSDVRRDARGHTVHEVLYCQKYATKRNLDSQEELVLGVVDGQGLVPNLSVRVKKVWLLERPDDGVRDQRRPIDLVAYFRG